MFILIESNQKWIDIWSQIELKMSCDRQNWILECIQLFIYIILGGQGNPV